MTVLRSCCQALTVCVVGALLSSCGWRLQGAERLPSELSAIRIETVDAYSDFYRELRGRLQAAGAAVDAGNSASQAIMQVHRDETGQRVLSVSARNRPEEYEVYYRVEYSVSVAGAEIVQRHELQLTASYSYDSRLALAKQHEQAELQLALARELAAVILRRLDAMRREANRTAQTTS